MKIGVFDSGLGGLTAVRELIKIAPGVDIVYLGDTGRVPYGSKSRETVITYSEQAVKWLINRGVEAIIIACGTVSSVALERLESPVPMFGVVGATAYRAVECTNNGKIGVIATEATIRSKAYEREILRLNKDFEITSRSCPLFVPLVENGRISADDKIVESIIEDHLRDIKSAGVDTLLLGCTHYPLLSDAISRYMGRVTFIDAGREAARSCVKELGLNQSGDFGEFKCYVTDFVDDFQAQASVFIGDAIISSVEKIQL